MPLNEASIKAIIRARNLSFESVTDSEKKQITELTPMSTEVHELFDNNQLLLQLRPDAVNSAITYANGTYTAKFIVPIAGGTRVSTKSSRVRSAIECWYRSEVLKLFRPE